MLWQRIVLGGLLQLRGGGIHAESGGGRQITVPRAVKHNIPMRRPLGDTPEVRQHCTARRRC
jgi:hypothetical protein